MISADKRKITALVLAAWIVLWANFIARDFYRGKRFGIYKKLAAADGRDKRAYTYGKNFFELLEFARARIPNGSFYDFAGVEKFSIEWRRGIYYLYPLLRKKPREYLLVYGLPAYSVAGYGAYAKLDEARYILRRR